MNDVRNPYAPPAAQVEDPTPEIYGPETLIEHGRSVPIGNGVRWLRAAFAIFFQRPWKWIGVVLLFVVLSALASIVPLSNVLSSLFWPVIVGGLAYALDVQRQTRDFTFANVFSGFGPRFVPLFLVGCAMLLMYPIMYVSMAYFSGSEVATAMIMGDTQLTADQLVWGDFGSAMLVYFALSLPLMFAIYLAPALIVLHGMDAAKAMKMSLIGCAKNALPGLLYCILLLLVVAVSAIPLFLGLFVTIPVAFIVFYPIYRDIFVGQDDATAR